MIYANICVITKERKTSYLRRVVVVVVSFSKSLYANILSKILSVVSLSISRIEIVLNGASFIVNF
jgi:hypothetical protein